MPVQDRLSELQSKMQDHLKTGQHYLNDTVENFGTEQVVSDFLSHTSSLNEELAKYQVAINQLKKKQLDLISSPFADKGSAASYNSQIQDITQHAFYISQEIKKLEDYRGKVSDNKQKDDVPKNVYLQQLKGLAKQFESTTDEFLKCQSDYTDKLKHRMKRQLAACGESDLSDEVLNKDASHIFTQNYLLEAQNTKETLRDLEQREKYMIALEKDISELNCLFKEVNMLVSQQGDMVDDIERNIEKGEMFVRDATENLNEAVNNQSTVRRKKIYCCVTLVFVLIFLVVVIVISFFNSHG